MGVKIQLFEVARTDQISLSGDGCKAKCTK